MTNTKRTAQQKWAEANPEIIKESKAKYDKKNPVWSFRPSPDLRQWLEEERWDDEQGNPETNAMLITRKLEKLRKLECQGF